MPKIDPRPGVEYWLNVSFTLKAETTVGAEGTRDRVGPVPAAGHSRQTEVHAGERRTADGEG